MNRLTRGALGSVPVCLFLLAACSGPQVQAELVEIAFTSHTPQQTILGSRDVTVSGSLTGGPATAVTASLNGASVGSVTYTETSFTVPVTLADGSNLLVVEATSGAGDTDASLALVYPFLSFEDFAPASVVIGQPDFTSNAAATSASGLNGPYGRPARVDGTFYLPDYGNDRVLGFDGGVPTASGAAADFVLGQADFVSAVASDEATGLDGAQTAMAHGDRLFVADFSNARVVIWNELPTTTQAPADVVVGQPAFGQSTSACTVTGMNGPESLFVTEDRLIVADSVNRRVLIFDGHPTSNGAAADLVLGQASFTTCAPNDDDQDGTEDAGPTARTLAYPGDVWTDGTRLVVADPENARVLIWNTFPTTNFQEADVVLGQADMTSNVEAGGAAGMGYPYFVASNGNQLFVADGSNHRVLVFDTFPTTDGQAADRVLGQSDFDQVTENDDDQDGVEDGTPSARTFDFLQGVQVIDQQLVVFDGGNNRALIFEP